MDKDIEPGTLQKDLADNLQKALVKLRDLREGDLAILQDADSPSPQIRKVAEASAIVLGLEPVKSKKGRRFLVVSRRQAHEIVAQPKLLSRMISHTEMGKSISPDGLRALGTYITNPLLRPGQVQKASTVVSLVWDWVRCSYAFHIGKPLSRIIDHHRRRSIHMLHASRESSRDASPSGSSRKADIERQMRVNRERRRRRRQGWREDTSETESEASDISGALLHRRDAGVGSSQLHTPRQGSDTDEAPHRALRKSAHEVKEQSRRAGARARRRPDKKGGAKIARARRRRRKPQRPKTSSEMDDSDPVMQPGSSAGGRALEHKLADLDPYALYGYRNRGFDEQSDDSVSIVSIQYSEMGGDREDSLTGASEEERFARRRSSSGGGMMRFKKSMAHLHNRFERHVTKAMRLAARPATAADRARDNNLRNPHNKFQGMLRSSDMPIPAPARPAPASHRALVDINEEMEQIKREKRRQARRNRAHTKGYLAGITAHEFRAGQRKVSSTGWQSVGMLIGGGVLRKSRAKPLSSTKVEELEAIQERRRRKLGKVDPNQWVKRLNQPKQFTKARSAIETEEEEQPKKPKKALPSGYVSSLTSRLSRPKEHVRPSGILTMEEQELQEVKESRHLPSQYLAGLTQRLAQPKEKPKVMTSEEKEAARLSAFRKKKEKKLDSTYLRSLTQRLAQPKRKKTPTKDVSPRPSSGRGSGQNSGRRQGNGDQGGRHIRGGAQSSTSTVGPASSTSVSGVGYSMSSAPEDSTVEPSMTELSVTEHSVNHVKTEEEEKRAAARRLRAQQRRERLAKLTERLSKPKESQHGKDADPRKFFDPNVLAKRTNLSTQTPRKSKSNGTSGTDSQPSTARRSDSDNKLKKSPSGDSKTNGLTPKYVNRGASKGQVRQSSASSVSSAASRRRLNGKRGGSSQNGSSLEDSDNSDGSRISRASRASGASVASSSRMSLASASSHSRLLNGRSSSPSTPAQRRGSTKGSKSKKKKTKSGKKYSNVKSKISTRRAPPKRAATSGAALNKSNGRNSRIPRPSTAGGKKPVVRSGIRTRVPRTGKATRIARPLSAQASS